MLKRILGLFKKKKRSSLEHFNSEFAQKVSREAISRMEAELKFEAACLNGYYCIKCHAPYQNIGIAFVCDCPPSDFIKSPIIYTEDLDPDIQKLLDEKFFDLLED
jgi:hypothetical protein